jgi:hypothetical protein
MEFVELDQIDKIYKNWQIEDDLYLIETDK